MSIADSKTQKYDRQLRLWHAHGQAALERSKVCLLNGSGVGTETVKNLILPGIGSLTVVDSGTVSDSDLGENFFVTPAHLGQPRAKVVSDLLLELNGDVHGDHIADSPEALIERSPEFFTQFTLVIATQISGKSLRRLADVCWNQDVPLIIVQAHGLVGYARIQVREHTVVETHPEQIVDLRFDTPFPALTAFAESFDFDSMDSLAHSHVPYIVILLKAVNTWKQSHNGALPSNRDEREAFKQLVREQERKEPGVENLNFEEALAAAYRAWTPTTIPSSILSILNDERAVNITAQTPDFWIIARAVRDFVANEGQGLLPLPGTVPDMHSDTESYINLQTIYRTKARQDTAAVAARAADLVTAVGRPQRPIPLDEIDRFCKHSAFLKVLRYRSFAEECELETANAKTLGDALASDSRDNAAWYVALRAAEECKERLGRWPGEPSAYDNEVDLDSDADVLRTAIASYLSARGLPTDAVSDDHVVEFVRAAGANLHVTAALLGGVVSQEAIKLLTCQYVPIDNTVVFDGVRSVASVYRL
ncbi:NEDD8-activating enzyme E1 regulatory subunit [Geranomyces michiganensis]|nr:NEDD8-activating enzyme E1 regulatory subunit [Geranomyces michiganensis]